MEVRRAVKQRILKRYIKRKEVLMKNGKNHYTHGEDPKI